MATSFRNSLFSLAASGAIPCIRPDLQTGWNGCPEYSASGVGDPRVVAFSGLVREVSPETIKRLITDILNLATRTGDTQVLADVFLLLFQTRNCRGGKGEKDIFHEMFIILYEQMSKTIIDLVPLIAHYGYWKDYLYLQEMIAQHSRKDLFKDLNTAITQFYAKQLLKDKATLDATPAGSTPQLTFCAKYAPTEDGHFGKGINSMAFNSLVREMFPGDKKGKEKYRKLRSSLNHALDLPEIKMCAKEYEEISFDKVPSKCLQKWRKAFLNEKIKEAVESRFDETGNRFPYDEGRVQCRKKLLGQVKEGKVHGGQLDPHEIVNIFMEEYGKHTVSEAEKVVLQAQWDDIKAKVLEALLSIDDSAVNLGKLVPLVDVSSSMSGIPMQVAIALGLLVSEITSDEFKHSVINFEDNPTWTFFEEAQSLFEKVRQLQRAPWGGSTNFEKAWMLVIQVLENMDTLTQDDVPDMIVFSDMQFNSASRGGAWETMHQMIVREFTALGERKGVTGLKPGNIIYWNLSGKTTGFAAQASTPGVQMLSGFSPSLLKLLLSGESLTVEVVDESGDAKEIQKTPYQTLRDALDDPLYDSVREVLTNSNEGLLVAYSGIREEDDDSEEQLDQGER